MKLFLTPVFVVVLLGFIVVWALCKAAAMADRIMQSMYNDGEE